jgi:hypothetical protein
VAANLYGSTEHTYCEPFAESLADDAAFRSWVLRRAGLGDFANSAVCLRDEQRAIRPSAKFWWKNFYCHEKRCICPGLAGREIDVLAIFRDSAGRTVGLHVECKHPKDEFSVDQAKGYQLRASCWGPQRRNPPRVMAHDEAVTILICDRGNAHKDSDVKAFDVVLYFDEIGAHIPGFPASRSGGD